MLLLRCFILCYNEFCSLLTTVSVAQATYQAVTLNHLNWVNPISNLSQNNSLGSFH